MVQHAILVGANSFRQMSLCTSITHAEQHYKVVVHAACVVSFVQVYGIAGVYLLTSRRAAAVVCLTSFDSLYFDTVGCSLAAIQRCSFFSSGVAQTAGDKFPCLASGPQAYCKAGPEH